MSAGGGVWRAGPTVPLPRFLLQATAGSDSAVACQRLQSIVTHTASLVLEADLRSGLCHTSPRGEDVGRRASEQPGLGVQRPHPQSRGAGGQPRSLEGALWKVRNELKAVRRPPCGLSVLPTTQP